MVELLKKFMCEYAQNTNVLVDSKENYYKLLESLTAKIQQTLSDVYLVKGSCGQGRKSECPWVCIFNKKITEGARNGIYYAILFKSDMSGFYLSLCLGMEKFKEIFKKEWENKLLEVANYFRRRINNDIFNLTEIDLNVDKNTRGYGYEISTIIAKYYELGKNELEIEGDINRMAYIYDGICEIMESITYSEVIDNILSYSNEGLSDIATANYEIEQAMLQETDFEEFEIVTLREIDIPKRKFSRKLVEMSKKKIKKRDYVESSKKQAKIGLKGEQLVIEYEKQKMILHNREDLIEKINWVSEIDDSSGYDIESFNFDEKGNEYRIYIEVKTTENDEKNVFFITANEIDIMKKLSDKYWIYRVCNTKKEPVFYRINGKEFNKKVILKEYTYIAEVN